MLVLSVNSLSKMKSEVQKKLIDSAVEVFAQHGYRDAKIAAIVEGAGANIAAVNYHFGSKDNLFVSALREAYAAADETYPTKGELSEGATAKEKVGALARAILLRSLDEGRAGDFNRIMCRTMHSPGSPIELILREVGELELSYLESNLGKHLKTKSQPLINWAVATFISLATIFSKRPNGAVGILPANPSQDLVDSFVDAQIASIFNALESLPNKFPKK